ncbi:MAG: response regulator [Planctomycetes bacterium]|nr:response regulator [Planctomycetota bacterium]
MDDRSAVSQEPLSVLVVEDDPVIRSVLVEMLSSWRYHAVPAATMGEAMDLVAAHPPDIVIADVGLPDGSGLELLEWTRRRLPLTAFIVVTGRGDTDVVVRSLNLRADGFLQKPFDFDALEERIANVASKLLYDRARTRIAHELSHENRELSAQLDIAISRSNELFIASLRSLANAIDARDSYTARHSLNVSRLAVKTAYVMGLGEDDMRSIRIAGELHDIGKIGVPESILLKPAALTPDEFNVMKEHPARGAFILSPLPEMDGVVSAVRSHHERHDGRGYPDGIASADVPLFARILAVCDAWDAMTSDRPYRPAMPSQKADSIVIEEKGRQFHPDVVDAFREVRSRG